MWRSSTVLLWSLWLFVFVLVSSISAALVSGHNSTGNREEQLDCGFGVINNYNNRIWNGSDASPGQYPFMVALRSKGYPGLTHCGGVIIGERHILTARHCLEGVDYQKVEVLIGDYDASVIDGETIIPIEPPILHEVEEVEEDDVDLWNDIALIRTREPMRFFLNRANGYGSVNRICMLDRADRHHHLRMTSEKAAGSKLVVAGWGAIDAEGKEPARKLQQLEVKSVECPPDFRGQICARGADQPKAIRKGDSGGPLFWLSPNGRAYLFGLVSRWDPWTGEIVFVSVRFHWDWIAQNIWKSPPPGDHHHYLYGQNHNHSHFDINLNNKHHNIISTIG